MSLNVVEHTLMMNPASDVHLSAATPEIIEKVHDMNSNNRRVKVREIIEAIGLSYGTVITILHEELVMKKLLAK